jgi:hypothetical protein
MKLREIVMVLGGMTILLAFIAYMFDFYNKSSEIQLIKRDMYFDSLILVKQKELEKKDSIFEVRLDLVDSLQNEAIKKRMGKREREQFESALEGI